MHSILEVSRSRSLLITRSYFIVLFALSFLPGPSPGFCSRGGQKPEGVATFLKHNIGCMQQPGGQQFQMRAGRAPLAPRWRRPCWIASNLKRISTISKLPPLKNFLRTPVDALILISFLGHKKWCCLVQFFQITQKR